MGLQPAADHGTTLGRRVLRRASHGGRARPKYSKKDRNRSQKAPLHLDRARDGLQVCRDGVIGQTLYFGLVSVDVYSTWLKPDLRIIALERCIYPIGS